MRPTMMKILVYAHEGPADLTPTEAPELARLLLDSVVRCESPPVRAWVRECRNLLADPVADGHPASRKVESAACASSHVPCALRTAHHAHIGIPLDRRLPDCVCGRPWVGCYSN